MNMKRLLCVVMAMLLAFSAVALAETDDLQAQLDAANARIAELEAEVELYRPFYDSQIVAEFGEDGIVWLEDAKSEYEAAASAYAQYGLSIDSFAGEIKQDILESLVRKGVLDAKAAELGLSEMDDEALANLKAEAEQTFESYIETYKQYFAADAASDDEAREQTIAALAQYGMTQETLTEQMVESFVENQMYDYVTSAIEVSDEEIQAKYEAMVAGAEEEYADDHAYNNARNGGETILWNPEGYRAVKHVLIKFDDEQSNQYSELKSTLDSLEKELKALDEPAEEKAAAEEEPEAEEVVEEEVVEEEAVEENGEVEIEETVEEETAEPTPAPRAREEIQADIDAIVAEISALHEQLLPKAQQVIDEFNAGASFESLIEKYNEDPGMQREPSATNGYAVAASSTTWDPAFTEGAMSIEGVGQISAPVYGQNGIHIIYYLSDITPGPVPLEEVVDTVKKEALEEKKSAAYDAQVAEWVDQSNPRYYLDRF